MIVVKIIALAMLVLILLYINIWYGSTKKYFLLSSFKETIRAMVWDVKIFAGALYTRAHSKSLADNLLLCFCHERFKQKASVLYGRKRREGKIPFDEAGDGAMVVGMIRAQEPSKGGGVVAKNGERVSGKEAAEIRLGLERLDDYKLSFSPSEIYRIGDRMFCKMFHPQNDSKGCRRLALVSWDDKSADKILPTIKALGLDVERFLRLKSEYQKNRQIELGKNIYFMLLVASVVAVLVGLVYVAVS